MRFKGFIGPTYQLSSSNIETQRCVNLYPELNEIGTSKEGDQYHYLATPGLTNVLSPGQGPIRCEHVDDNGNVLVASGDELYKLSFTGAIWQSTLLGNFNSSSGTIVADSNKLDNGDIKCVFVDGTDSYSYESISGVDSFDDFAGRGYSQVNNATHVVFIDGFFIFNVDGSKRFYVSDYLSLSTDPLSFASAEGDPDNIVGLTASEGRLWLLNEKSLEIFANSGNPDFPFERAVVHRIGCIARHSIKEIGGFVFWLGRDKSGQGSVYASSGGRPERISTHAIEHAISQYEQDAITTADAFTYSMNGHSFYVLNFPLATWVFDTSTKMWHERAYNNSGLLERHRANHHVFVPQYGIHLVGDYENNKIYQMSDSVYEDDGEEIPRIRSTPHLSIDGKVLTFQDFELDMETGVGLSGSGDHTDPQCVLRWSNDGGHTWSNEMTSSIGKIGEYLTRVRFLQLGSARDRVFEIKITAKVKVKILGARVNFTVGAS